MMSEQRQAFIRGLAAGAADRMFTASIEAGLSTDQERAFFVLMVTHSVCRLIEQKMTDPAFKKGGGNG